LGSRSNGPSRLNVHMNRIDPFTHPSLFFILLASAVVRSTAVAIDRSFAGQYLDCSWTTKDFRHFADTGHTAHSWPCRGEKLKAWTEKNRHVSTIVCIGDSITEGSGLHKKKQAYPHQLYVQLRRQYNVVNLGVAGVGVRRLASSPSFSSYLGSPHWSRVIQRLSNVHTVIVQLGTNDAALGTWNRTAFRDDYVVMLQFAQKMYPHADIITSIPPPCEKVAWYSPEPGIVNNELGTEITAATKLANLEGPPVNMQNMFASQNATAPGPLLQKDGLHPSTAGHYVMASAFITAITRMR